MDELKSIINNIGIDLFGVVDLNSLKGKSIGVSPASDILLDQYKNAIILGLPLNKLGNSASGNEASLFMEKAALQVLSYLQGQDSPGFIIHTEDEFDPINRKGLISLKVFARLAGLGWQGRSLLIISPTHGPIFRLIAILTNMDIVASKPIKNQCNECTICIDKCPTKALTYQKFEDFPKLREDILNIPKCKGDEGCKICLLVCPYFKLTQQPTA
jgi:epoxyqueuosine reductase